MNSARVIIALLCACLLCVEVARAESLLVDGSFETTLNSSFGVEPTGTGYWGKDPATIVSGENGISPLSGSRMLRFDATSTAGLSAVASDIWQLVDVSSLTPGTELTGSVYFNRVAGNAQTDTAFALTLQAFSGTPQNFNTDPVLASSQGDLLSDSDPLTWQQVTTSLVLPTGTTFVGFRIAAIENVQNNTTSPEFAGHYADLASLEVTSSVPLPAPLVAGAMLLAGWGVARRARPRHGWRLRKHGAGEPM